MTDRMPVTHCSRSGLDLATKYITFSRAGAALRCPRARNDRVSISAMLSYPETAPPSPG